MNKKNFVVTPNYLDRESPIKWLIRDEDQENPLEASTYTAIKATGVTFKESTIVEKGFGCGTVAICEDAEGFNDELHENLKQFTQLSFDPFRGIFYVKKTEVELDAVKTLYLTGEGKMYAELN